MEKREGLRAGISSIRQDYRSGGLVSKEGPRLQFNTGSLVKTKQQFYSDYEKENPKPPGGGKAAGGKRRAAYAAAQEKAFSNYLGDIAQGVGFTPTQSRDAFKAEYEKTNPAPKGRRVYYKTRDAWNAGFNTAFDNYQQSYVNDLSAALAAKDKEVAAANAAAIGAVCVAGVGPVRNVRNCGGRRVCTGSVVVREHLFARVIRFVRRCGVNGCVP